MSKHDDQVSLKGMLSHAREAVNILGATEREDLGHDRVMQLALTRLVEIIGEAANRVYQVTRRKYPEIPWPQIIGMRNRLIHGYDIIDYNLLWDTVANDLPPLIMSLEEIFNDSLPDNLSLTR